MKKKARAVKRKNSILVAVNVVPFNDKQRTELQQLCINRITDLRTMDIVPLNICFSDEVINHTGWTTAEVLSESARNLNIPGKQEPLANDLFYAAKADILNIQYKRKPFVNHLFNAAADWAKQHDINWFIISNSDILFTPALIDEVRKLLQYGLETVAISRNDIDRIDHTKGLISSRLTLNGFDVFVCQTAWYNNNRDRFQPYIFGERAWDQAYAAIMACHSRFHIFYTNGLCYHFKHEVGWQFKGPYSDYNMSIFNSVDKPYQDRFNNFMADVLGMPQEDLSFEITAGLIKKHFYME
jgi:hypothetical protein